ncbi:MAG: hypothetical protein M1831_003817 [Alyxoria varia]|nr:MAG: hypothetical protein M1831_003817 [Alyxoria varia]
MRIIANISSVIIALIIVTRSVEAAIDPVSIDPAHPPTLGLEDESSHVEHAPPSPPALRKRQVGQSQGVTKGPHFRGQNSLNVPQKGGRQANQAGEGQSLTEYDTSSRKQWLDRSRDLNRAPDIQPDRETLLYLAKLVQYEFTSKKASTRAREYNLDEWFCAGPLNGYVLVYLWISANPPRKWPTYDREPDHPLPWWTGVYVNEPGDLGWRGSSMGMWISERLIGGPVKQDYRMMIGRPAYHGTLGYASGTFGFAYQVVRVNDPDVKAKLEESLAFHGVYEKLQDYLRFLERGEGADDEGRTADDEYHVVSLTPNNEQEPVPEVSLNHGQESSPEVTLNDGQEKVPEVTFNNGQENIPEVTFHNGQESTPEVTFNDGQENTPEPSLNNAQEVDSKAAPKEPPEGQQRYSLRPHRHKKYTDW